MNETEKEVRFGGSQSKGTKKNTRKGHDDNNTKIDRAFFEFALLFLFFPHNSQKQRGV
jgi:hypothetical protein